MKIANKPLQIIEDTQAESKDFSDRLDALKFMAEVQSTINRDISSDAVLAKLSEKDKIGIIEVGSDAYFCLRITEAIAAKTKAKGTTESIEEAEKIKAIGKAIFDGLMTRIYLVTILNRNVDGNYLLKLLAGAGEEEERLTNLQAQETLGTRLKDILKPKRRDEEI